MAGDSMNVSPDRQPNKEIKVQNMNKRTLENFQPEPQPNSEQKADKKHVSPAIAKPTVIGIFMFVHRLKPKKLFLSLKQ